MRRLVCLAALVGLIAAGALAGDPPSVPIGPPRPASIPSATRDAEAEVQALTLIGDHLPELAPMLGRLKATNPTEYRKAVTELATEARTLADLQVRNPARGAIALDAWKARRRVEFIAAQLTTTPSAEREVQLRAAIEDRFDVDLRRQRFEIEQNEAALVKIRERLAQTEATLERNRETLARNEKNRTTKVESRFRALLPKKSAAPAVTRRPSQPSPAPASTPSQLQGKSR